MIKYLLLISVFLNNSFASKYKNHFKACHGKMMTAKDSSIILCREQDQDSEIDNFLTGVDASLKQIEYVEGDKLPQDFHQFILQKFSNREVEIKELQLCIALKKCPKEYKNIKELAQNFMPELKMNMAMAFNEIPVVVKDGLLSRPSLIGGDFPLEGESIRHPVRKLANFDEDKETNNTVNDLLLVKMVENSPYLLSKVIKDTKDYDSKTLVKKVLQKMRSSESISDHREMGERNRLHSAMKKMQINAKNSYIKILSKFPVLAYLNSNEPSPKEVSLALENLSFNISQIIERYSFKKDLDIDLLHYQDYVEEFLKARPEYCYSLNRKFNELRSKKELIDMTTEGAAIATNIACPFVLKGMLGKVGCATLSGGTTVMTWYGGIKLQNDLKFNSFYEVSHENPTQALSQYLEHNDTVEMIYYSTALSALPFVRSQTYEYLFKKNMIQSGSIRPGKGTGFNSEKNFERFTELSFKNFKPSVVSKSLLQESKNLPDKIKQKFKKMREKGHESKFEGMSLNKANVYTNASKGESVIEVLKKYPRMQKPVLVAHKKLSDKALWVDYFEKTIGDVFKRMLASGNPKLVKMANEGILDEKILLKYFTESFKKRGLKISEIRKGEDVLPFYEFTQRVRKGPILDNAFSGNSRLADHGPYPHLFQLDYLIDDMAQAGGIKNQQEFFEFFATQDGLKIWNDTFDLFKESANLKSTNIVTNDFLKEFLP